MSDLDNLPRYAVVRVRVKDAVHFLKVRESEDQALSPEFMSAQHVHYSVQIDQLLEGVWVNELSLEDKRVFTDNWLDVCELLR